MAGGKGSGLGALIVYRLGRLGPSQLPRFTEKVLGMDRKVGDRTYRRRGLLDEIPHWKVTRGVVVVHPEDRARVVREIRRWTHEVEWWEVTLNASQARRVRAQGPG
jgi:hypothetical protein